MYCRCDGVFLIIVQTEKGCETDAAHASEDSAFLCVETIREHALMPFQV